MTNWWYMRLSHFSSLLALSAAACLAQELSVINLTAPENFILAGRGMKLTASPTSNFGTPISGVVLQWVTSNVNVATVNGQGEARGTGIGVAEIVARDPATGVSGKLSLRVLPLAIDMDPQELDLRIGSTTKLTARASDADAKPIVGTKFKYSSGLPSVVTVAPDGTLTPVSEGVATVYAEPDGASGFGFVASSLVRVLRRADYTVKKVLDSGAPRPASILGMTNISGSGDVFGGIAALSNGSQAVVIFEQGVPRVVAATGQQLSSTGRVIVRINGLSVNANGDAAVYAEFPDQFCGFTLLLFTKNQEEAEIADGCSIQLLARGLADDGTLVYRLNDSRGTNVMRRKHSRAVKRMQPV